MPLGGEVRGCLDYRNTGSWTWGGVTRLGTSMPRDRASEHVGSDWLGPNRLATVSAETPRGAIGRFCFSLHAAATVGEREERFSLVHEGSFWAADVGGVADDVNVLIVNTVPAVEPEPAPDVPDVPSAPLDDAGPSLDGGADMPGAETPDAGMSGPGRTLTGAGCAVTVSDASHRGAPLLLIIAALRRRARVRAAAPRAPTQRARPRRRRPPAPRGCRRSAG